MSAVVPVMALGEAGFAAADERSRAFLLDQAARALPQQSGSTPGWAWFVPGRIEIIGKHTDYAGGASLVAAVPRGFAVVARPRDDGRVSIIDARWSSVVVVDPIGPGEPPRGWGGYVHVVARRLVSNFPGASLGVDLAIASDLPRAAGLSSSSALVVAVSLALIRRGALSERPEWTAAIHSELDLAGYLGAVEAGGTFASLPAAGGVGTQGGAQDHTAILASRPDRVRAFSYLPVRAAGDAPMPRGWQFVVMTSGVHADKAGRVRGQYNRASEAVRAIVDLWRRDGGQLGTLASILARPGAESRLRAAIERETTGGFTAGDLQARLTHFMAEQTRVPLALDAFRTGDWSRLGALSDASQADAERLLGNQVPETIALARAAREAGAPAASSFGAGFGGSVWALVDREPASFARAWERRYRTACPDVPRLSWFAARPGPAAFELTGGVS